MKLINEREELKMTIIEMKNKMNEYKEVATKLNKDYEVFKLKNQLLKEEGIQHNYLRANAKKQEVEIHFICYMKACLEIL